MSTKQETKQQLQIPEATEKTRGEPKRNLGDLILPQDFAGITAVKEESVSPKLKRPPKQTFFSINPDTIARIQIGALKDEEDGETYVVAPPLFDELADEWVPKTLIPCVTKQGAHYFWPVRLPDADGKLDSWNESALRIAGQYAGQWIRVVPHREEGAYRVLVAESDFGSPQWPASSEELLERAFEGLVIDSLDHPVVQRLRGIV